ncbi:MAG: universal stress protein [Proteobacteria bacterium]|nr:universal stress protein [Pseudomonadota bacterium]
MEIKKILCPTDFSEAAKKAFEYAVFLASSQHAELVLLHVVDQLHGFDNYEILSLTPQEISERMETHAYENMSDILDQIKGSIAIETAVEHGKSSVQIIEKAREVKADIIVMGSHGRTGLSHVLIGSVAETVVRHASCPVLVVKNVDHRSETP